VGVAERVDVKLSPVGLVLGPQLGVEWAFLQDERRSFSLEPRVLSSWSLDDVRYTFVVSHGWLVQSGRRVNISLSAAGESRRFEGADVSRPLHTLRPEVSYDVRVRDRSVWLITGRTNAVDLSKGWFNAVVGGVWAYGSKGLGASAGLNLVVGGLPIEASELGMVEDALQVRLPALILMPTPHFQVWARL